MELNALSVVVGVLASLSVIVALYYILGYVMNLNRYGMPKFLPRDDEVAWSMAMSCPHRIWSYQKTSQISYDNWDLGILKVMEGNCAEEYDIVPRVTDMILVPQKWGGYWAVMVFRKLQSNRFATVFLGEFANGKVHSRRNRQNPVIIS